jgi:AcrR family transcriptional regulator
MGVLGGFDELEEGVSVVHEEQAPLLSIRYVSYPNNMSGENQDVPYRNSTDTEPARRRGGRPRSEKAHRAILDAARAELIEEGFTRFRLEHVAARAGVGKATIYRRWPSKEALAGELLAELAAPHIAVIDSGDTRAELASCTDNALRAIRDTTFGPVVRALLSQIAVNPRLGDPFRATVVQARRAEVARVVQRGIARGDLRPDTDLEIATELLVGPVYFRLIFGGELDDSLVVRVADAVMEAFAVR